MATGDDFMPARRDRTCRNHAVRFGCAALPGAGIAAGTLMAPTAARAQMPTHIIEKIGVRR
jgi:hypothetical protein